MKTINFTVNLENTTAGGYYQIYELVGKNCIPCCPECGQGMHTRSQAKACKKQNPSLNPTFKMNKYYFSRFECFWRWLLF